MRFWCWVFVLSGLPQLIQAHEHWVDLNDFSPQPREEISITIGSGHHFPESETAIADRVLARQEIIDPNAKAVAFTTVEQAELKCRGGKASFAAEGWHSVAFALCRPPLKEPEYWAKAIVGVGKPQGFPAPLGHAIEIVPLSQEGETMSVKILYEREAVKGTVQVTPAAQKTLYVRTDAEGVAHFPVKEGKYLLTAHHAGKGCSLTFCVAKPEVAKEDE